MRKYYRPLEKEILAALADLSMAHGPVEVQLTEEDGDGDFIPSFIVRTAPDGVLRGLMEDDRIADLSLEYGELHILPAPAGLDEAFGTQDAAEEAPAAVTIEEEISRDPAGHVDPESLSWERIDDIGVAGNARRAFRLGDTKSFTLKTGERLVARIIGFDHDRTEAGAAVPITWELMHPMDQERPWNETNTNADGWKGCALRAWLNGELLEQLPDDLRGVIKPVVKRTSAGEKSDEIVETVDAVFIKSEWEQMGRCFYSKPGEGKQYAFYKLEGAPWAMQAKDGSAAWPALRSPTGSNATAFCDVLSDGTAYSDSASTTCGVAFGFCV